MNEYQIVELYTGLMTNNAIFMAVNIFLLWMMFRGVNVAHDRGSNLIQKILSTVVSSCVIFFNLGVWGNISSTINNWAFSMSQLEEISGAGQAFVTRTGASGYADPSLLPADPVSMVFWAVISFSLIAGIWMAPNAED